MPAPTTAGREPARRLGARGDRLVRAGRETSGCSTPAAAPAASPSCSSSACRGGDVGRPRRLAEACSTKPGGRLAHARERVKLVCADLAEPLAGRRARSTPSSRPRPSTGWPTTTPCSATSRAVLRPGRAARRPVRRRRQHRDRRRGAGRRGADGGRLVRPLDVRRHPRRRGGAWRRPGSRTCGSGCETEPTALASGEPLGDLPGDRDPRRAPGPAARGPSAMPFVDAVLAQLHEPVHANYVRLNILARSPRSSRRARAALHEGMRGMKMSILGALAAAVAFAAPARARRQTPPDDPRVIAVRPGDRRSSTTSCSVRPATRRPEPARWLSAGTPGHAGCANPLISRPPRRAHARALRTR